MKITNPANLALNEITYGLPIIDIVNYTLDKALHLMAHPIPDENTPDGKKPIRFATQDTPSFILSIPPIATSDNNSVDNAHSTLPQEVIEKMTTTCTAMIYPQGEILLNITDPNSSFEIGIFILSSKKVKNDEIPMENPQNRKNLYDGLYMTAKIRHKEKNCYSHFRCNYTPTKKKIKNKITISIKDSCNKRPLDYTITNLPVKDYSDFVAAFSDLVNISINTKNKIVFGISWTLTDNPTADDTDPDCTQLSNTPEDNSTPEHP